MRQTTTDKVSLYKNFHATQFVAVSVYKIKLLPTFSLRNLLANHCMLPITLVFPEIDFSQHTHTIFPEKRRIFFNYKIMLGSLFSLWEIIS